MAELIERLTELEATVWYSGLLYRKARTLTYPQEQ